MASNADDFLRGIGIPTHENLDEPGPAKSSTDSTSDAVRRLSQLAEKAEQLRRRLGDGMDGAVFTGTDSASFVAVDTDATGRVLDVRFATFRHQKLDKSAVEAAIHEAIGQAGTSMLSQWADTMSGPARPSAGHRPADPPPAPPPPPNIDPALVGQVINLARDATRTLAEQTRRGVAADVVIGRSPSNRVKVSVASTC